LEKSKELKILPVCFINLVTKQILANLQALKYDLGPMCYDMINNYFALKKWQTCYQCNLANKLNRTKMFSNVLKNECERNWNRENVTHKKY